MTEISLWSKTRIFDWFKIWKHNGREISFLWLQNLGPRYILWYTGKCIKSSDLVDLLLFHSNILGNDDGIFLFFICIVFLDFHFSILLIVVSLVLFCSFVSGTCPDCAFICPYYVRGCQPARPADGRCSSPGLRLPGVSDASSGGWSWQTLLL